ncbi:hypothetical protein [Chryseobacterium herbae]|uniref:Uncharacterized protein n=1 Tax=Chryseobacterium herbae TaxID=2976476 RepID=A0ABT2ISG3_9FLAO|nr:hypothetical protein [Chryseobacterium sp. pc1-10]MCT2561764.1 hypothetical protein [Chryseobacterium sp. pc1-10]
MKIFNVQPITLTEYTVNEEHFGKSLTNGSYESGFSFTSMIVESVNTLIITFDILYSIDNEIPRESILSSDNPDKFTIQVEYEIGGGEIFLSYESSCQFNFESQDYYSDVLSITEFLAEYHTHTIAFLKQNAFKHVLEKEEQMRIRQTFKADAVVAIDSLR